MSKEVIHDISDRLRLSFAEKREDPFKLIFRNHDAFVFFNGSEWDTINEIIKQYEKEDRLE